MDRLFKRIKIAPYITDCEVLNVGYETQIVNLQKILVFSNSLIETKRFILKGNNLKIRSIQDHKALITGKITEIKLKEKKNEN